MVYIVNLCLIAIEISLKHLDLNNIINITCLVWFYLLFFCRMKKSLFIILGLMFTISLVGCGSWEIKKDDDEILAVKSFLYDQIKKEYGIGPTPEFHYDIEGIEDYYISPEVLIRVLKTVL